MTGASPFRLHLSPRPKSLVFLDSSAQMASGGATPQPTTSQRHTTAPSSGTLSSTTPLRRARGRSSVASWTWSRASCASSITLFCCSTGRPGPSTAVVVCLRCCIHTLIAPLVPHRSLSTGISLPITLIDSSFDLLVAVISSIRGYRVDEMPMLGCLFIVVMSVLPLLRQGSLALRLVWLWGGPRGWVPIGLSRRRSTHSERRSAREDESFPLRERLVVSPLSSACSRRQLIADDDPLLLTRPIRPAGFWRHACPLRWCRLAAIDHPCRGAGRRVIRLPILPSRSGLPHPSPSLAPSHRSGLEFLVVHPVARAGRAQLPAADVCRPLPSRDRAPLPCRRAG